MFICPKCKKALQNYSVCSCGYEVNFINSIMQLTDLPDLVIDTDGDNYIGYEHIGKYYSGYDGTVTLSEKSVKIAQKIIEETGNGVILDLGCGDGNFTIPLLSGGAHLIGGDISNGMMNIILEKAEYLKLDMSKLILCRMNAYDIPLEDKSVNAVISCSMLHLNSNPKKIIDEVYRVLKDGGKYICFEDSPNGNGDETDEFDNNEYHKMLNMFYKKYFDILNSLGLHGRKYSWKFDKNEACQKLFKDKKTVTIELPNIEISTSFTYFYNRMKGRGYSILAAVPQKTHNEIFEKVDNEMKTEFGEDYTDCYYREYQKDIVMTLYIK